MVNQHAGAGKVARRLDANRVTQLEQFVENARQTFAVPGVAIGVIQNGKVVLAKGFGVRKLGDPKKTVDAETLFMIASNTKALTTLMLAKLVDAGRFSWETPVTHVMPTFELGNAQTTRSILMKHLVCACTGLPRQDMETVFEGERLQPASVLPLVATMQPTSALGELYQYSNLMAGAAGYIGGHVLHPGMEPGAAYDAAMQTLVFDPLKMTSTTFAMNLAQRGNYASPHAHNIDGQTVVASMDSNHATHVSRPDGGAWSNVNDLLRYVQMEIEQGRQIGGKRYISAAPLLARRAQQISRGSDLGYGMGLKIDHTTGTTMIHHGGTMTGYISDMLWLPEHKVGAVILTNAQGGTSMRNLFRRRLLELLFDANPEASANAAIFQKSSLDDASAQRKSLTIPPDSAASVQLARHYRSAELGEIRVEKNSESVWFDFGGWKSEMASRQGPGATTWFVTIVPGEFGFEFRVKNGKRRQTLVLNDGQRDYVFVATH